MPRLQPRHSGPYKRLCETVAQDRHRIWTRARHCLLQVSQLGEYHFVQRECLAIASFTRACAVPARNDPDYDRSHPLRALSCRVHGAGHLVDFPYVYNGSDQFLCHWKGV